MNKPELYSKYSASQRLDNLYVLDNHLDLSRWRAEDVVLDVGSGDGRFSVEILMARLPGNFGKFIGCDCSEVMVEFAKKNHRKAKVEFVHFDIAAKVLPEDFEGRFHHIFSFYTLHWVKKQRKAFENMYKLLKPGGDMLLTFLASNSIFDIYLNMSKIKKWKPYSKKDYIAPYHGLKHPEKQLEKLMQKIGFVCSLCKVENRIFVFHNFDSLRKSVMAINPVIPNLPPEDIPAYMDDFVKEVKNSKQVTIENTNNNGEESIKVEYKIFIVSVIKPVNEKGFSV
uniref:Juvenile hormone acid O-methyltransferase n=1 Tax=Colaphellus bowringi TaxID=561076 RepID=A0A7H1K1B7_9CUCU|nr:juvenile hormone acid O-methyltransferase [Colaphellus bowringi]